MEATKIKKSQSNLYDIPKIKSYNGWIEFIRMQLAISVLFSHIIPWYNIYDNNVYSLLGMVNVLIVQIFQSSGETNPAVLAFIVLSGYCIHRNGFRRHAMDVEQFFVRRFFRILPLLLVGTIAGGFVFNFTKTNPFIPIITSTDTISIGSLLYKISGLFVFFPFENYQNVYQGNAPLITCIVEFWLYMFYPIISFYIMNYGDKVFWCLVCGLVIIGATACLLFPYISPWWNNGSFFSFLIYWWIGAYAVDQGCQIFKKIRPLFVFYAIFSVFLIISPNMLIVVEIKKILFCLLFAILLRKLDKRESPLLLNSLLFKSSFSLYALHVPLICVAMYIGLNLYVTFISIIMSSYLFYLCIEKPSIEYGKNWYKMRLTSSLYQERRKKRSRLAFFGMGKLKAP